MNHSAFANHEIVLANWYHFIERVALDSSTLAMRALPDSRDEDINGMYAQEADGHYAIWRKADGFELLLPCGLFAVEGDMRVFVEGQPPARSVRFQKSGKSLWVGKSSVLPENVSTDIFGWPQDDEDLEFLIFLANFINTPRRWGIPGWKAA